MFVPRGIRNNNFGNIEDGPFAQGLPGYAGGDGRFARFASPDDGLNAMSTLLGSYGRRGINSINGVINRWAPASDGNHVGNYAAHVSQVSGFAPDAAIDLSDPSVRAKLARGMAEFENGPAAFNAAYSGGGSLAPNGNAVDATAYKVAPQAPRAPGNFGSSTIMASTKAPQSESGIDMAELPGALQGAGAALASIGSPQQGAALATLAKPRDKDQFHMTVNPATGAVMRINNRTGEVSMVTGAVPVKSDADKAYDTAMGKHWADLNEKISSDATRAGQQLAQLDQLKAALSNPNVYQGAGGDTVLALKKAAQAAGFNVEGVADAELASKVSRELALQLRNPTGGAGMPGALSDQDRKFLESMVPSLQNSPQGNAQIVEMYRALNKRALDIDNLRAQYEEKNGRIDAGFNRAVRKFANENPLFANVSQTAPVAAPANRPPLDSIFK